MYVIGFDTSNYTTSAAYFDGEGGENFSSLLSVEQGRLGLRQSDAVFAHVKGLPELSSRLFSHVRADSIAAVGVSTRPRAAEGSYMPCFMVGYSHAKLLADCLGVPLITCAHQQGHVASALWSAGRLDLMDRPHLAWHLSGGTTELLYVELEGKNVRCAKIGGTTDISAGQLIDRTGVLLGLSFPAGKHLDALSQDSRSDEYFRVKCPGMEFSLSGVENQMRRFYEKTGDPAMTASFAIRSVCYAVKTASIHALSLYPGLPLVLSGGVASNSLLRSMMQELSPVFAQPAFSTDNAMGPAVLAWRCMEK